MRIVLAYTLCLLLLACANGDRSALEKSEEVISVSEDLYEIKKDVITELDSVYGNVKFDGIEFKSSKPLGYNVSKNKHYYGGRFIDIGNINTNLYTKKLQDYYDLLLLEQQHPDFKTEISSELQKMGAFKKDIGSDSIITISNVTYKPLNARELIFYYQANKTKDSLIGVLEQHPVLINGDTVMSQKIRFKNFND